MSERMEMENQNETEAALASAKEYISTPGSVVDSQEGFSCIDGRSSKGGNLERPGGHWGYIEVLLAMREKLGLSVEECVNRVFRAVTADGSKFYMHTDKHTEHEHHGDKTKIGCGYIGKAMDEELAVDYVTDQETDQKTKVAAKNLASDVKEALRYSRYLDRSRVEEEPLEGEHEEIGIIRVTGTKKTVVPQNAGKMYFIYDMTRDTEYMKQLVEKLTVDGLKGLTLEDFKAVSDKQLMATAKNLAAGKPIFDVNADLDSPEVSFVGKV